MLKLRKALLCNYLYYIIIFLALLYFLITTIFIKHSSVYNDETSFVGTIIDYKIDGDKLSLTINGKEKIIGTYYFQSLDEKNYFDNNLGYGYELELLGSLEAVDNNTIPNTFNYKKYLYNKKIFYSIKIEKINILSKKINCLYRIKNLINRRISTFKTSAYLKTFILGDKNSIDSEVMSNYQKNGITHLFAISGMHVSLFALIINYLLNKLKISENKRYFVVIVFLLFYIFLTNYTSSILRAGLFFMLLSINNIYYTNVKVSNILLLTLAILIFINPFILYDLGFQYSYVTSFSLIYASDFINSKNNYFLKLLKVSLIAFLFSMPITLSNFYEINLMTIINNIIFVPIVTTILYPLSLLTFILPFLDNVLMFFITIFEEISVICNLVIININIPKYHYLLNIIYYCNLLLLIKYHSKKYFVIYIATILFMKLSYLDKDYRVFFLDVKQGDSALIVAPYNKEVIMIDVGGKLDYSLDNWQKRNKTYKLSSNTITFLKSMNISTIDLLILTHGDDDHAGETLNISNNINIKNVILNNYDNKLESSIRSNINVVDNYQSRYINYQLLNSNKYLDENDDSIITIIDINNYQFLFMGDAGVKKEKELLNKYDFSDVDVLKIGHHGSTTSSCKEFIENVNPEYAIISVGKNNKYGHPKKTILDRLNKYHILRTDMDGSIMFRISIDDIKIDTWKP